jgi:ATP-dependent exoDNAse (exonuclease V) beta subunit
MHARGGDKDPVYEYLARLERDEEDAELGRLLYVGCTRAKERLHLIAALDIKMSKTGAVDWARPPSDSALAKLGPMLTFPPVPNELPRASPPNAPLKLRRLARDWRVPEMPPGTAVPRDVETRATGPEPPFDWARETARHVGTVAHRLCRQIGEEGLDAWTDARVAGLQPRLAAELAHQGVVAADLDAAVSIVQRALKKMLADPRGRWLFDASHREASSEHALTSMREGAFVSVVLDRSFVDAEDTRWIVDFKFSQHEGTGIDAFLDNERERYRAQLDEYAKAIRGLDPRPIRLGLYFPLLDGWREWPAS